MSNIERLTSHESWSLAIEALRALPTKELGLGSFITDTGEGPCYCVLGSILLHMGIPVRNESGDNYHAAVGLLGDSMVNAMYSVNDINAAGLENRALRWERVYQHALHQVTKR